MSKAFLAYLASLVSGESEQFNVLKTFDGSGYTKISASGVVSAVPTGVYRLVCVTPGTSIKLWDNASAASGDVLVETVTMTANQPIVRKCFTANGVFATLVGGGLYHLVHTGA